MRSGTGKICTVKDPQVDPVVVCQFVWITCLYSAACIRLVTRSAEIVTLSASFGSTNILPAEPDLPAC